MKKPYSLDFSIERDTDRMHAVEEILDKLERNPSATELEQMASYILYGKDENGQNAIQRNEMIDKDKRYKSYKTKDDKVQSLDEIMAAPGFDEQEIRPTYKRQSYILPKPCIKQPKYDKKTGEMIDPGDSDVPGMLEQWEIIARWQRMLDIAQGKIPPEEGDTIVADPYRIYQLKHNLIDIRRHQYYLKDSAKPTLHFQNLDHPKTQFYDWCGDSFYWLPYDKWKERVDHSYTHTVSTDIADYETRGEGPNLEVKWVVCRHTFDWENYLHVRALLNFYDEIKQALHDKLNTYGITLIWDLERYIKMCNFHPTRQFLLKMKFEKVPYEEMVYEFEREFGFTYNLNHLSSILANEIPKQIARAALRHRLLCETPKRKRRMCRHCKKFFPLHTAFYNRNNGRPDGFSPNCRECERLLRVKGGQATYDQRYKI